VKSWGLRRGDRFRARRGRIALCTVLVCAPLAAAERPEVFAQLGHSNVIHTVAFAPNGRTLASGGEDGATKLWDLGTQRELRALKLDASGINSVAFSPDGAILATGNRAGTLVLWEVSSGRVLHTLKGHAGAVNAVTFAPGGHMLASAGADHSVRLWDAASGSALRTLAAHHDAVMALAFAPDGHTLASGSVDKTIRLWDAAAGSELRTLSGPTDRLCDARLLLLGPHGTPVGCGLRPGAAHLQRTLERGVVGGVHGGRPHARLRRL
jgi:WD40 repeat protein